MIIVKKVFFYPRNLNGSSLTNKKEPHLKKMRLNYRVDYLIVLLTIVNSLFKNKILIVQIS